MSEGAGIDRWLIVGSRRWARIVAAEVCAAAAPDSSIQLHGSRTDPGLAAWWNDSPHKQRIEIVEQPVPCGGSTTGVALIVNSAHQHRSAVERALDAGYHVVCEKPLTFSRDDTLQLLARADARGLRLFGTNTYLFADYLRVFRREWLAGRALSELELTWADARAEVRHGQAKSYDSGVPVIFDVLPHVAGIVLATHGRLTFDRASIDVARGGAAVVARYAGGDLTLRVSLARNAARRVRLLRFSGPGGQVALDFAAEPGVASVDREPGVCVDAAWHPGRRPIAQMLRSVEAYFERGVADERLGPDPALLAHDLIDAVADGYVRQQLDLLDGRDAAGEEDHAYAAKEADAIRLRAWAQLPAASPLRRLVQPELSQSGRGLP